MIICDLCKKDPIKETTNDAVKQAPWGLVIQPPPGSGLSPHMLCWPCWDKVFEAFVGLVRKLPAEKTPN
jgi:hypothetical protein